MPKDAKPGPDERAETDESLRRERENADRELARRRALLHDEADVVVEKAREKADAVIDRARTVADQRLADAPIIAAKLAEEVIERERAVADRILRAERDVEDDSRLEARREESRLAAQLLPKQRQETDLGLDTERRRADKGLEDRDDFLSIVSHDLRNLLSGIVLSAELIDQTKTSERILRYANRMTRLLDDLLDVGSIEAGRLAVHPIEGDLAALLHDAVETSTAAATAKQIGLSLELIGSPLTARFDATRIHQVVANFLSNAIKFTPEGGHISVRCEQSGESMRVSVTDTGIGIAAGLHQLVFDRFWQVGQGDRRGLGLGLYISRCIIEAHRGRIHVASELGQGSTFSFTLPS